MISVRESLHDIFLTCKPCAFLVLISLVLALYAVILVFQDTANPLNQMPDMTRFEQGAERKNAFFEFLTPVIDKRNQELLDDRQALLAISRELESGNAISGSQERKLKSLANQYKVEWNPDRLEEMALELELRVDSIPVSLVVVQAAKESGWGTSKFAREGNNLFGEWCHQAGCGIVPAQRAEGARHEVRIFDSAVESILAYMQNINTGRSYDMLRELRAQSRLGGTTADGLKLADGLIFYSERRQAYVDEVKTMIRQYHAFQEKNQK